MCDWGWKYVCGPSCQSMVVLWVCMYFVVWYWCQVCKEPLICCPELVNNWHLLLITSSVWKKVWVLIYSRCCPLTPWCLALWAACERDRCVFLPCQSLLVLCFIYLFVLFPLLYTKLKMWLIWTIFRETTLLLWWQLLSTSHCWGVDWLVFQQ